MALFLDQLRSNPNARVTVTPNGSPEYTITAFITENFEFGGGNQFNSAMEAILSGAAGKVKDAVTSAYSKYKSVQAIGSDMLSRPQAARVINGGDSLSTWVGSKRPEFTLNLLFLALNDGDSPIQEVQKLLRYVYPDGDTGIGMLTAPLGYAPTYGASLTAATNSLQGCSAIQIGQWFSTPPIFLMNNLQLAISQKTDPLGVPLYVQASMSFSAARLMTYSEVQGFFTGAGAGNFAVNDAAAGVGGIAQNLVNDVTGAASGIIGGAGNLISGIFGN